jgi:hypothetical protein
MYYGVKKKSIGPWWICGHRKENAGSAFVYGAVKDGRVVKEYFRPIFMAGACFGYQVPGRAK